jgi:hypothetical protein
MYLFSLGNNYNSSIANIPATVTHLTFGDFFTYCNDYISYLLPPSLTYLKFGDDFDSHVDPLPPSLLVLIFGKSFNCKIAHLPNLRYLEFGEHFNNSIHLPSTLKKVVFGKKFDQLVTFPDGLEVLKFHAHSEFSHPIDQLPPALLELVCNNRMINEGGSFTNFSFSGRGA